MEIIKRYDIGFTINKYNDDFIETHYCDNYYLDDISHIKSIIQECKRYIKQYKTQNNIDYINHQRENENFRTMTNCSSSRPKTRIPKKGYIYFLLNNTKTKIGKTENLENRILQLEKILGQSLILHHFFKTPDITKSEREIHSKYQEYRLNGEWFLLPEEELINIKENYK